MLQNYFIIMLIRIYNVISLARVHNIINHFDNLQQIEMYVHLKIELTMRAVILYINIIDT